jgi:hypothetical protein
MLLIVSIIVEAAVAVIAILVAWRGRPYIYGLTFTYAAYVFYDFARWLGWNVEGSPYAVLFLLASISALIAVWGLYRDQR